MTKTLDEMMKGGYEQITWPSDGLVNVQYLGQEVVETDYGDRVKIVVYDLIELRETAIYTTAKGLLKPLFQDLKVEINDKIAIKKSGSGFGTKYEVAIIARGDENKNKNVPEQQKAEPQKLATDSEKVSPF